MYQCIEAKYGTTKHGWFVSSLDPLLTCFKNCLVLFWMMFAALPNTPGLQGAYDVEIAIVARPQIGRMMYDEEETVPTNNAGLTIGYYAENLSYCSKQMFVCPSKDDREKQLDFYQGLFSGNMITKVPSTASLKKFKIRDNQLSWKLFSLDYGNQSKQAMDKVHQQWLCDITKRQQLFDNYNGKYAEYPNFTDVMKHLHLTNGMSIFIHLNMSLELFKLIDVDIRGKQELMHTQGAIFGILCNKQTMTSNDGNILTKRRKMDMNVFVNRDLNSMEKARLGTMLFWLNQIIPHSVDFVNNHQKAEFPLFCGISKPAVRYVFHYPCTYPCTKSILFVLLFFSLNCNHLNVFNILMEEGHNMIFICMTIKNQ